MKNKVRIKEEIRRVTIDVLLLTYTTLQNHYILCCNGIPHHARTRETVMLQILRYSYGFTVKQIELTLAKHGERLVRRAFDRTQNDKPGDRSYLKRTLEFYSKPLRPVFQNTPSVPIQNFQEVKRQNDETLSRITSNNAKPLIDCEVCGQVNFHGPLKHDWLMMKRSAIDRADCGNCKNLIANL